MKEMMKNRTYRDKIVYCAKDPKFVLIQMVDEDMIDMLSEQYHIISSVIEKPCSERRTLKGLQGRLLMIFAAHLSRS